MLWELIMNYDALVNENVNRNAFFLEQFEKWLKDKNLSARTIKHHMNNVDLYINDYLNYYEVTLMEDGVIGVEMFFRDWFVRKCAWTSESSIRATATSIKKFYECMMMLGFVKKKNYELLTNTLKKNMNKYIDNFIEYEMELVDEWF